MGFGDLFVHSVGLARFTLVCFIAVMADADRHGAHGWLRVAAAAAITLSAGLAQARALRRIPLSSAPATRRGWQAR